MKKNSKKVLREDVFDRPKNRIFLEGYDKDGKTILDESFMVAKRSMLGESSKWFIRLREDGSINNKGDYRITSQRDLINMRFVEVDSSTFLSYASYLRSGKESTREEVVKGLAEIV